MVLHRARCPPPGIVLSEPPVGPVVPQWLPDGGFAPPPGDPCAVIPDAFEHVLWLSGMFSVWPEIDPAVGPGLCGWRAGACMRSAIARSVLAEH